MKSLIALICLTQFSSAVPFIVDDEALEKSFRENIGQLTEDENHHTGEYFAKAVKKCPSKCEAPPQVTTAPEDPTQSVFLIGSVYKCEKCNHWHTGGIATAWCLSADGLMVTNHHVFANAKGAIMGICDREGKVWPITEILATDPVEDVAIFRVGGSGFSPLPLAAPADIGTEVRVISHPDRKYYTQTFGEVSRYYVSTIGKNKRNTRMMITADYAKGSSGGPVLNPRNEVIGMVASTQSIYYGVEKGKPSGPLQMVVKNCVPIASISKMLESISNSEVAPVPES